MKETSAKYLHKHNLKKYLKNKDWGFDFIQLVSEAYSKGLIYGNIVGEIEKACDKEGLYNRKYKFDILVVSHIKSWEKRNGLYSKKRWNPKRIFVINNG